MSNSRERGFTLVEVMVALLVLGLAALALIRLQSATLRGSALAQATTVAQVVARNVAIDAITGPRPPALGRSGGVERNGGRAWRWTREVRATGDTRILRVDVAVADARGQVLGRITMVRPPSDAAVTS